MKEQAFYLTWREMVFWRLVHSARLLLCLTGAHDPLHTDRECFWHGVPFEYKVLPKGWPKRLEIPKT